MARITTVHVDGACGQNTDKIGGWAAVVNHGESLHTGYAYDTTNNRMELEAIRAAIVAAPSDRGVDIRTDSEWCVGALLGKFNLKKNIDKVKEIRDLMEGHGRVQLTWIPRNSEPSHARADRMAKEQIETARKIKAERDAESAPKGVDNGGGEE